MKILASISAFMLLLFLGFSTPVFPQEKPDKEGRPAQVQDNKDKDNTGSDQRHDNKAVKQDDQGARPNEVKPQGKSEERSPDFRQNDQQHPSAARPQEPSRPEQRTEPDRDRQQHPLKAQPGKHIPADRFRASFGREHHFHVDRTRIVNQPQPVIVYSGYSFQLAEPWPGDWSYDDDCYIDYVDGEYYLFDVLHPGIRIAVFVIE